MRVYYGTYNRYGGKGIYHCELDLAAGKQEIVSVAEAPNPTYLARTADGKRLYAVGELSEYRGEKSGAVAAYEIMQEGSLCLIGEAAVGGGSPCHISLSPDGRWLFAANYSGGNAAVFSIAADGGFKERRALITHEGSGPDPKRQTKPYCHFAQLTPDNTHLCVTDLGTDAVVCYPFESKQGVDVKEAARWRTKPGAGPRHLVFSPDARHVYVAGEMGNCVEAYAYNGNGAAVHLETLPTLPEDFAGESTCAAIRMSADGRRLYVSNRGHDSVAVFAVKEDGRLSPLGAAKTGGKNPREIQLTPDGRHMLCGHQDGGGVTVLRVNADGTLAPTDVSFPDIPAPVCILF